MIFPNQILRFIINLKIFAKILIIFVSELKKRWIGTIKTFFNGFDEQILGLI